MISISSLGGGNIIIFIPIICGPTGSGKTGAAVRLAENFPIEVISADSRQVIKHLNIGTAKPTPEECKAVKFHLVDLIDPGERFSAFKFIDSADRAISDILSRDKIPIIVGGTGLYLKALSDGVVEIEEEDMAIREKLEEEMEQYGPEIMYDNLMRVDPLEAVKLHPNNQRRVIRALEIFYLTGKTKSEIVTTGKYFKSKYSFKYYCLAQEREILYKRINTRIDQMLEMGWLNEIQELIKQGLGDSIRRANVIGYSELLDYLEGKYTLEEAVLLIKQNTRRYAKRQMTWFRNQTDSEFYESADILVNDLAVLLDNLEKKQ
ncbi:MAG: tRNA (adenosine(37)-N6)-dimethylallyltransferase MiaA [bacterium]